eukprot:jgi/Chlat1/430/Chrsp103S01009
MDLSLRTTGVGDLTANAAMADSDLSALCALPDVTPEETRSDAVPSSSRPAVDHVYFEPSQKRQLQIQMLIYKYLVIGAPVPQELLFMLLEASPLSGGRNVHRRVALPSDPTEEYQFHAGLSRGILPPSSMWPSTGLEQDPHGGYAPVAMWGAQQDWGAGDQPNRCRRTDGKKWRCSRAVVPMQKYCEAHMHRGRHRPRKHGSVSVTSQDTCSTLPSPSTSTVTSLATRAPELHDDHKHASTLAASSLELNKPQPFASASHHLTHGALTRRHDLTRDLWGQQGTNFPRSHSMSCMSDLASGANLLDVSLGVDLALREDSGFPPLMATNDPLSCDFDMLTRSAGNTFTGNAGKMPALPMFTDLARYSASGSHLMSGMPSRFVGSTSFALQPGYLSGFAGSTPSKSLFAGSFVPDSASAYLDLPGMASANPYSTSRASLTVSRTAQSAGDSLAGSWQPTQQLSHHLRQQLPQQAQPSMQQLQQSQQQSESVLDLQRRRRELAGSEASSQQRNLSSIAEHISFPQRSSRPSSTSLLSAPLSGSWEMPGPLAEAFMANRPGVSGGGNEAGCLSLALDSSTYTMGMGSVSATTTESSPYRNLHDTSTLQSHDFASSLLQNMTVPGENRQASLAANRFAASFSAETLADLASSGQGQPGSLGGGKRKRPDGSAD